MMHLPNGSTSLATGAPGRGPDVFGETPEPGLDIRRFLKTLARRRRLFLSVFAGFFTAVVLFTLLTPRNYTVSTKLIAGSSSADSDSGTTTGETQFSILNTFLANNGVLTSETYAELLEETPVAQRVIDDLGLTVGPDDLLRHISVKPVTNTAILNVSVSWRDAATAAKIANDLAGVFVSRERDLVAKQADVAVKSLETELPDAQRQLTVASNALTAYQQQTGISDLGTQTTTKITSLAALDAKLKEAEQGVASASASLDATEARLAETPETIEGSRSIEHNPVVAQLETQIATLKVQLQALRQQYQDDHPSVIQARAQLAEAERQLAAQPETVTQNVSSNPNPVYQQLQQQASLYEAQQGAAKADMDAIREELKNEQPALDALPEESHRIVDLQRDLKAKQDLFDAINTRLQTAQLSRKSALSDIAITQPADATDYTTTPNTLLNAVLGAVVGLVLAFTAVFVVEFFDDRLRTTQDVRERLALPVLATIPMLEAADDAPGGGGGGKRDGDWIRPLSVESFYQLVASLRYTSSSPPRTIAFTSATQGDGKSTIAVNTAISMALMKARVLVIDADLRRPSVHAKLEMTNERGLSDALVGLADFDHVVRATTHEGVSVVTSGRRVPNPVALLQSEGFDRFLQTARERYDFVIVDGPALTSIVDGVVIGIKTDGTVLIVNASSTSGRSAQLALSKLRAVPAIHVLGVVINGTRPDPSEYSDYYLGDGRTMALPNVASP